MSRLSTLESELADAQLALVEHQAQLDAARRKGIPDRTEQNRLRELVAEDKEAISTLQDDIAFERTRLESSEEIARRAAGRAKRDAVFAAQEKTIGPAWLAIESGLKALTGDAHSLRLAATTAAGDISAVARQHYEDPDRSRTAAGQVSDLLLGDVAHANAVARLLAQFVHALPPGIATHLAKNYALNFSGVITPTTGQTSMADATSGAARGLRERCASWVETA